MSSSPRSPPRSWAARWKNESCRFGQGIRIQGAERAHRHRIPDVALKQNSPGLMLPPIKKSPESRALRGLCLFLAKGPVPGSRLPALPRYGKMTGLPETPVPALVLSSRPPPHLSPGGGQCPYRQGIPEGKPAVYTIYADFGVSAPCREDWQPIGCRRCARHRPVSGAKHQDRFSSLPYETAVHPPAMAAKSRRGNASPAFRIRIHQRRLIVPGGLQSPGGRIGNPPVFYSAGWRGRKGRRSSRPPQWCGWSRPPDGRQRP